MESRFRRFTGRKFAIFDPGLTGSQILRFAAVIFDQPGIRRWGRSLDRRLRIDDDADATAKFRKWQSTSDSVVGADGLEPPTLSV